MIALRPLHRAGACALAVLLNLAAFVPVHAASPALAGASPRGAQRGTEVEVILNGARLEDAKEILFYESGIEVTKFEVVKGDTVKAVFKISPDAYLGSHRFRVRTASGISDLRPFLVGELPEIQEKEPNTEFSQPQPIPMGVTVNGVIQNEDVDFFVVEAKKGERITAEVEAIRLGASLFDVYVAILNTARFELTTSDDTALVFQDGIVSIIAPEDGKYIIQIRDSAYGGNGNSLYRAHIGSFPRPLATLPVGGKLGETLNVKFIGDVAGNFEQQVTLPTVPQQNFSLFYRDNSGISPSGIRFRLSEYGNVIEQEPNDTHDNATKFAAPLALNGIIGEANDSDNFRFTAKKDEAYDVRVYARGVRSPLDPILTIFTAGKGQIAQNDDSAGPDSYLRFRAPADGDYVINIKDHLGNGGPHYTYRIELTPIKPQLSATVIEFQQYIQPTVSIPKGNRCALALNASRADFGGPLALRGENLPKGVTMEIPPISANQNIIPVIFHVADDAEISGTLADLVLSLNDPKQTTKIEGSVSQPVVLVRGQNQVPFWTEPTQRIPVAVTEEVPFSISIVEPKVPLVTGGEMPLKVVAKRKEGFTAAIKIDMLWRPSGINAATTASIPEGKNEADIILNAINNADATQWKVAAIGQAPVNGGNVLVATTFANLRVAEKYLNATFDQVAVEQGKEANFPVHFEKLAGFKGAAKAELVGLPRKVEAAPVEITEESKDVVFKLKADMTSPPGNHQNILCRVTVMENGEQVVHNLGPAKLRVDAPLPPKKTATTK